MNVLVCIKRVPETGARITLTPDQQEIDTRHLGFTISPHEECAVEEALRLVAAHGGSTTVLTLGPEAAVEQLRNALAMGCDAAVLLETDGREWDPMATAAAIADAVRAQRDQGRDFDLLLFGNEAADTGDYQVGIRVAHALGLPCVTGVKALELANGSAVARREASGGLEELELALPAVITVKEGINLPRFASVPGRLRHRQEIDAHLSEWTRQHTNRAVTDILEAAGVAAGPVYSITGPPSDPHLEAVGYYREVPHSLIGPYRRPGPVWHMSETPVQFRIPTNLLGEHNRDVFCGILGLSEEEYLELERQDITGDAYKPGADLDPEDRVTS